jgi:16S rRNA C967 or C1407 C5-methylase (RsmB/RsmF family)
MLYADDNAQDAAKDQRSGDEDRYDQSSREWIVHQQEATDHVENAHQQMQRECTPLAIHEGVHDLEHACHQNQRADEDDAGDGERDDIEPCDRAQHELDYAKPTNHPHLVRGRLWSADAVRSLMAPTLTMNARPGQPGLPAGACFALAGRVCVRA